ncbi:MAX dimerization protein MGA a isoform X3 [Carassius gibelio]|uniref:MAX dimerization protein MGA a isoform X3 n=1 Tax=Carassius gibelio TaxID=101364 RepID=UPI00227782FA|nr:MAX dimerization protein MGA a isoform X3 [Carassius gibelio]XP_052436016.1 MAX dimerization protein MGA a isoform X3 [Carassius gibelio]
MADTEKQGAMVVHEEGVIAPTRALPTTSSQSIFVVLKQLQSGESGKDKGSLMAISEANEMVKSTAGSVPTGIHATSSTLADTNNLIQSENMPADARCKGITATLDNNSMWNEFYKCQTEMILTKQGRRMFPYCRFRLSGMEPFQSYLLAMDIVPVDNYRYKWSGKGWETNGKAEPHVSHLFVHPESPATGLHWMQYPVSFYRLKLCNNLDQEDHIILHSMQRYLPRLHIIPADKDSENIQVDRPNVITLCFSQTEFFAVTAYQNLRITQLKIDYNPFAKGFRDDAVNARSSKARNGISTEEAESELKLSKEMTTLNNLKTLFMKRNAAVKVNKDQNVPSPTNGEGKAINGDAPVVNTNVQSLCKKRPSSLAFSDFIKGAHVKVKRLSLENIKKNGVALQASTTCTSEQMEVIDISSKTENILQVLKDETMAGDIHRSKNLETFSKTELEIDQNKSEMDEHKGGKITLLSSDQNNEKGMETISSLDTVAKSEGNTKKALPHKRPERVPLPLLAQFLKQRKSKTRPTTPKPNVPSSCLDSEKSCEPVLTPENSSALLSSIPFVTSNPDSQPVLTSLSEKVTLLSTTDASNITSESTVLSSPSATASLVPVEMQLSVRHSPSLICSDPSNVPNTTYSSKPDFDPTPDTISSVFHNDDAVSMPDLVNTLRSQSYISSLPTCDTVNDTCSQTTPEVNTDSADTTIVPSVTTSVLDVPSSTDNSIIPFQQLTSITDVAESDSMSDCPLDSSKGSCTELFSEGVPQNTLFTHKESLSLSLDDNSSPAFSLPSPTPSSPDPFPPSLFCERPVPPRKTLDSFPERLLDCTASSSPDLFPLGLFNDRPVPPRKILDFVTDITLDGTLTSKESLSPSVPSGPEHPRETIALFFQSQSSDRTGPLNDVQSAVSCETIVSDHIIPEQSKQSSHGITFKKSKAKQKKNGNLKFSEDNEVFEGPIPVPMQPSLEDVEGQLFVSFMSKKALEIHLGDDDKSEAAQKTTENPDGASYDNAEDKIGELEKILLNDLKVMRHRQVIHPVLQEVGLKLNLLDPTLEIDLQYLGVQLPIPPTVLSPERSSASSQIQFVSRTGKTSDFTKIKGWRDKFSGSGNPTEGMSSTDAGQKNLSAFCSDMLDEYLASEGKLIDERAATLSQADVTPVAYQLPIKSTSYVLTLDSVLKKQVPATLSTTSSKVKPKCKTKEENKSKKPLKSGSTKQTEPVFSVNKPALGLKKQQQNKKSKNKKESKSFSPAKPALETAAEVASNKTSMDGSIPSSCAAGRTTGLPKTLVKLMDVEDGAVWEGKHRTFITEERAAIALATLVTAEGVSKGNPEAMRIIRRRAPPCLNVFCRLGCVCASLVHLRRHHHCGKPQCMLGCSCLRRKVVALKTPKQEQSTTDESEPHVMSQENKAKWKKKNKKRKTYVLTNPVTAPEPAKRVSTLWDRKSDGSDSEALFCPPLLRAPSPALLPHELQHDLEIFFSPSKQKRVDERNLSMTEDNMENKLTCARSRPFSSMCRDKQKVVDQHHISQVSTQADIEEGELVPLNLSGPAKRLEIISECSWASTDTRNYIMQIVCEHMAQDRLKHPFWIGKYFIQPVSKTLQEKEDGSVDTYKVIISQPAEKKTEDEKVTQNKAELKNDVEKSEVKGLPFLSRCCPAGLLKAEKKAPDSPGCIMVNGKSYPQAKLELGKMGALHPANRLAAYITGRICPVSQSGPNLVTTSTVTKASITSFPVSTVSTATTVTSTSGSTARSLIKSVVTKPPVGKVFTQFVVNHINSQNLTNTSTSQLQSSVPKVVIPSSMLMIGEEAGAPGVALSPVKAGLVTQVSKPSESTGSASFPTVSKVQAPAITILTKSPSLPLGGSGLTPTTTVSSPGSTTTGKKTVYIKVMARSSGLTSSCPSFTKPATQTRPTQTQSQKVLLQVVKTADGKTLYRNPNGQLLQLVPLSQIKAIKPNLLTQGQPTILRLPAPTAISPKKPQGGSTTVVKSLSPIPQTQRKPAVTVPVSTSSSMSTKPVTLTSSKAISLSSVPSTLKVVPGFLGQSGTCTLRILPPHPVQNTQSIAPTSSPVLPKSGFTLLKHGSSTLYSQDSTKSETGISVSSVSTEEAVGHVRKQSEENRCDNSERLAENISKLTSSSASNPKPSQFSGGGSSVAENGNKVNPIVTEKDFDMAPVSDEEEINSDVTELTDDSDLYSDEDDDQEDTYSLSGSDQVERRLDTDGLGSEMKDFAEVVVDIETIEEPAEENCITKFRASALRPNKHLSKRRQIHNESLELKVRRVRQERIRRRTLKECFLKLQATLGKSSKDFETSKMRILTMAQNEIESLVKQDDRLMKKKQRLQIKRERYLQTLSLLCDKSTESISQKLNEIIAKQKALETQSKAKENSQLNEARPKPKAKRKLADLGSKQKGLAYQNKLKDVPKPTYSPSKPMDLSIKKQKSLEKTESASKPAPTAPSANLDSSQITLKTQDKEKVSTSKPSQPSFNASPQKKPVSVPSPLKHSSIPRERTRPNILSRASSQVIQESPVEEPLLTNVCIPQVFPLMHTMVPYNQIITINPLKTIGITSVGTPQSSTPGVASVSIVPAVSHPVGVENPLPLFHPQMIKIANSPVNINTQVDTANIPNITNVISLIPPAENLVIPQKVVEEPTSVPAPVENQQYPSDVKITDLEERAVVDETQSKDVPKQPVGGDENSGYVTSSNQDGNDKKYPDDSNDHEDENLLSLLDELVLLSQQLSNEDEDQRIIVPDGVQTCSDKQADLERDDDRALSPLFLTLDEDLMSPDSKDEIDIPPKVDDLVKVIFGSDSPSVSSESGVAPSTNVQSPQAPVCSDKGDALTPPPLLHMKAACEAASGQSDNEGTSVAWRPMPKLVPLGLKAQDAVVNKVTGSPVFKPNSHEENVHRPQM